MSVNGSLMLQSRNSFIKKFWLFRFPLTLSEANYSEFVVNEIHSQESPLSTCTKCILMGKLRWRISTWTSTRGRSLHSLVITVLVKLPQCEYNHLKYPGTVARLLSNGWWSLLSVIHADWDKNLEHLKFCSRAIFFHF